MRHLEGGGREPVGEGERPSRLDLVQLDVAEGDELVITERQQGTFSRQLLLGDSLDTERITARYDQGVLTITIPVAEQSKARKVQVARGGGPEVIEATSSAVGDSE